MMVFAALAAGPQHPRALPPRSANLAGARCDYVRGKQLFDDLEYELAREALLDSINRAALPEAIELYLTCEAILRDREQ